jgi:xylulokinase
LWLKRHEPEVFSKAKHFYTTLESVTGFLCGNFVTDPTNIALTRLYDYKAGCYIPEALEFLGITEDMLPTVAPCGSVAGKLLKSTADKCGLPEGIPVYVGAHDQYCASIGSGVTEPGQLLIATGTAWVLFGVTNDLFKGMEVVDGKVTLSDRPGIGLIKL